MPQGAAAPDGDTFRGSSPTQPDQPVVGTLTVEDYVDAFRRRTDGIAGPGLTAVEGPGLTGLVGTAEKPGRLLITDDRALDQLACRLPELFVDPLTVLAQATACEQLVRQSDAHAAENGTAMVSATLDLPAVPLPGSLTLRPIRRVTPDDPGGVPLDEAVTACLQADVETSTTADELSAFLRSLPGASLLAAVDEEGVVRGTSGWAVFDGHASIFFVSCDLKWRGQGVGTAMTAAALRSAHAAGARRACLDASDTGRGIYLRLGFKDVGRLTRFFRRR